MEEKKKRIRISVRNLVEFLLRSGDLDDRRGGVADKDAMQAGTRAHQRIQKKMGPFYQAEVPLAFEKEYENFVLKVEGRADGILEQPDGFMVEEIKGTFRELELLEESVPVHLAQAKCYAFADERGCKAGNFQSEDPPFQLYLFHERTGSMVRRPSG